MQVSGTGEVSDARILAGALEPFAAQVYFAPEAHAGYAALGFSGSRGEVEGVAMPDGPAYFCSRGALLGQVSGQVVAAAFGVFNPAVVVAAIGYGWSLTTAREIREIRDEAGVAQLRRILGDDPPEAVQLAKVLGPVSESLSVGGHPLYSGLLALPAPDDDLGAAWRFADRLREFRGDVHIAVWTSAGFDAVEIGLLTEMYWGMKPKTYVRSRAWSNSELDDGLVRLEHRGLIVGDRLTEQGRLEREAIEVRTDEQCAPILDGIGGHLADTVDNLRRLSDAVRAKGGYPAAGPHDLAAASA
jgi:Helix-turn-helix family